MSTSDEELIARVTTLEQYNQANIMPDPRGNDLGPRNLTQVLLAMEAYVVTLKDNPQLQKTTIDDVIDFQLKTALAIQQIWTRVRQSTL